MRRASVSIGTNIAEGCGHHSDQELIRFLQIAMGSASEVEYQLLLAYELRLLDADAYTRLWRGAAEVKRMLASLLRTLRAGSRR
jgi:four helix bundle protein